MLEVKSRRILDRKVGEVTLDGRFVGGRCLTVDVTGCLEVFGRRVLRQGVAGWSGLRVLCEELLKGAGVLLGRVKRHAVLKGPGV